MGSFLGLVVTPQQYSDTWRFSFDNGLNWGLFHSMASRRRGAVPNCHPERGAACLFLHPGPVRGLPIKEGALREDGAWGNSTGGHPGEHAR